ncbi:hypothetical protein BH09SUM1_BH09SUM1_33540 [soil metagenome]
MGLERLIGCVGICLLASWAQAGPPIPADGAIWVQAPASGRQPKFATSAVYFKDAIYTLSADGLVNRSEDGLQWEGVSAITDFNQVPALEVLGDKLVFVKNRSGTAGAAPALWSSDDGRIWTSTAITGPQPFYYSPSGAYLLGFSMVNFNGKLRVFGGGTAGNVQSRTPAELWSSEDGLTWTQGGTSVGVQRIYQATTVFNGRIYTAGGERFPQVGLPVLLHDVWYTEDGETWTQATDAAEWSARINPGMAGFNGNLYVAAGSTSDNIAAPKNDVWASADGVNWVQRTNAASWSPRQGACLFSLPSRLLILGGTEASEPATDHVWYSDVPASVDTMWLLN